MLRSSSCFLLHEYLFVLFFVTMGLRLGITVGFEHTETLIFFGFLLLNLLLLGWCQAKPTDLRWRIRLVFYPIMMNVAYLRLETAIPLITPNRIDASLQAIDLGLFGIAPGVWMQTWIHPVLTEVLSFCYSFLFLYLLLSFIEYLVGNLKVAKWHYTGLFTVYAIGLLFYSITPAEGPYLAMPEQFHLPLEGGFFTQLNAHVVAAGSNRVDVFPSLHCAASCYLLFFDRVHKPWRFWLYLLPCLGLWLSTIYLRYHYFIDVLAGFILASCVLWIVLRNSTAESLTETSL